MHKLVLAGYDLDLPPDFGILISKSIAEIREPENRNSDWTKTIRLPGSKTNKKAFTHLFDLGSSIQNTSSTNFNPDFNPNLKAPVAHYVDEVLQLRGFLKLNNIIQIDYTNLEFECTLYGQLADLFTSITEARLRDLDFTEFNHSLNVTRITESWGTQIQKQGSGYVNFASGNPTGEGYAYALIDDGTYVNYYGDTNVSQFYPALYTKQIVDKIFEAAGYSYTLDSFFNTEFFKKLLTPCPTGMKLSDADIAAHSFEAEADSSQAITTWPVQIEFQQENDDPGADYSIVTSKYTVPQNGSKYDFSFFCDADLSGLSAGLGYIVALGLYVNGGAVAIGLVGGTADGTGALSISQTVTFSNVSVNSGDTVDIRLYQLNQGFTPVPAGAWTYTQNAGSLFYGSPLASTWGLNQTVNFDAFFNDGVTQYDFLKSIFNQYHIYAEPSDDHVLFCYPEPGFYNSDVKDWTDKLDQSRELEIVPMGELNANPYYFTYSKGEDEENKDYQAAYDGYRTTYKSSGGETIAAADTSRVYGDKLFFINNDHLKNTKKVEVIFAPSQFRKVDGFDKYLTYIPLKMDNGTGQLRQLYYGGLETCNPYVIYDSPLMTGTSTARNSYLLALHLDHPTESTVDLNFGMPFRVNVPAGTDYTNNNLFNNYWRGYINQITDKNSKIVRGWFNVKPADIEQLSFRDLYYFERSYFRLNSISDYNPDGDLTHCEFLQLVTAIPFTGSSGGLGAEDEFGDLFPTNEQAREIESRFGQVALVVGRNNQAVQSLLVGDNIAAAPTARINSALGSENVSFGPGVEGAVVLDCNDIQVASAEFWLQNSKVNLFNPSNGDTITYNASTNTWEPSAPANVSFGMYTPTITEIANLDDSEPYQCQWMRVGDVVTVSGYLEANPTTLNLQTTLTIELPFASTFEDLFNAGGSAVSGGVQRECAAIGAEASSGTAFMTWKAGSTANTGFQFSFTYLII